MEASEDPLIVVWSLHTERDWNRQMLVRLRKSDGLCVSSYQAQMAHREKHPNKMKWLQPKINLSVVNLM